MAAIAGRILSSIFSKAPSLFRSVWGVMKSNPALSNMKNVLLTTALDTATKIGG
jgi:hypothetical protein